MSGVIVVVIVVVVIIIIIIIIIIVIVIIIIVIVGGLNLYNIHVRRTCPNLTKTERRWTNLRQTQGPTQASQLS